MISGQRVLALILARGGSKGVPRKNVRIVGGKPLIAWTIDAAHASTYIDRCVMSSDDSEIMEVAQAFGCDVPFRRPAELARDDSPAVDAIMHALAELPGFDIFVLLQPTSPLRNGADIDACLQRLIETDASSCVTVREVTDHPYWTYLQGSDGRLRSVVAENLPASVRRQELPRAFILNGAIYAARVEQFQSNPVLISGNTVAYEMPPVRSVDIDTLQDLREVEEAIREGV